MKLVFHFLRQTKIGCRPLLSLTLVGAVVALAATADRARAVSGTIDFGVTHTDASAWDIVDDDVTTILLDDSGATEPNPSPQQALSFDIPAGSGVAEIKMTRDEGRELVTLPLPNIVTGDVPHTYRIRTRFKLIAEDFPDNGTEEDLAGGIDCAWFGCDGHGPDIHVGFFDTTDLKVGPGDLDFLFGGDNDTVAVVIESTKQPTYAARVLGGAYGRSGGQFPEGSVHFGSQETWYVMEIAYRPDENDFINRIHFLDGEADDEGVVSLEPIVDPVTGVVVADGDVNGAADIAVEQLNAIGFGNVDIVHETGSITAAVDWITWAIDDDLPPDPPCAGCGMVSIADLNKDGFVDGLDLGILLGEWNPEVAAAMGITRGAVPEPASIGLLAVASLSLLIARPKRS